MARVFDARIGDTTAWREERVAPRQRPLLRPPRANLERAIIVLIQQGNGTMQVYSDADPETATIVTGTVRFTLDASFALIAPALVNLSLSGLNEIPVIEAGALPPTLRRLAIDTFRWGGQPRRDSAVTIGRYRDALLGSSIERLKIEFEDDTMVVPSGMFVGIDSLRMLDLRANRVFLWSADSLGPLPRLEELVLLPLAPLFQSSPPTPLLCFNTLHLVTLGALTSPEFILGPYHTWHRWRTLYELDAIVNDRYGRRFTWRLENRRFDFVNPAATPPLDAMLRIGPKLASVLQHVGIAPALATHVATEAYGADLDRTQPIADEADDPAYDARQRKFALQCERLFTGSLAVFARRQENRRRAGAV